jgi:hypothetical protein
MAPGRLFPEGQKIVFKTLTILFIETNIQWKKVVIKI